MDCCANTAYSGKIQGWRIEEFKKVPVPPQNYGEFYSGESYVILYSYIWKNKDCHIIYFWQGRTSSIQEKGASALLTIELDDKLLGMAKELRVTQNKEPKHFLTIFKGKFVVHMGKEKDGNKGNVALYQIYGTSPWNVKAIQVRAAATSLSSTSVCVLKKDHICYIWWGKASSKEEREFAKNMFPSDTSVKCIEEQSEPDEFWRLLNGKERYPICMVNRRRKPRLFECSVGSGVFKVDEIMDFTQDELSTHDVYILDAYHELFIWVGKLSDEKEKIMAMEVALEYQREATDGRPKDTAAVFAVYEGHEPLAFTGWYSISGMTSVSAFSWMGLEQICYKGGTFVY